MIPEKDIERCCELLSNAEAVLIGAGAGLTTDAGIDYTDKESFARDFPGMVKLGFSMRAELVGFDRWSPDLKWGYLAAHVNQVRFGPLPPVPVYGRLLDLVREKDSFVITSNADGLFARSGFAEERLFTPQGDYALMQCQKPCTSATWPTKPVIEKVLPKIEPATQRITDPGALPRCPNCGGDVMLNVRGGDWFIEEPYREQAERFSGWVRGKADRSLLILEFGSGFNTPGVIRWRMEHIVYANAKAHLVRVNLHYPQVPEEIAGRSVALEAGAMQVISAIWTKTR
jgi:NAD-dependent SIR2 family protein deacetylase